MKSKLALIGLAAAFLAVGDWNAQAATSTWSGNVDTSWSTAGNWDALPGSGDNILFPNVTGQTADLGASVIGIGALTFNAPDAYSLGNGGLTLGGDLSQNGAGTVTLNVDIDLGGANRVFGGSGSGVVTLNNSITGNANNAIFGAGNYVIANPANTINQVVITNGAKVTIEGTAAMTAYPNPSYLGGNGTSGGGYALLDGGLLDDRHIATDTVGSNSATFISYWDGHGVDFGPNGGTLLLNKNYPVDQGPTFYRSSATNGVPGTIVIGQPLPFSGDGRGDNFVGPWDVPTYGLALGPTSTYGNQYERRFGEGDLTVVITNGATAYLEWSVMTNGFLNIKGQPGGDSSIAEVDFNGTTTNVGRFCIRGPHRGLQEADYTRAFYMNPGYGIKFYDAVQVWERDGIEHLACDISHEPGSSVDWCGGKLTRTLSLGNPSNGTIPGNTNTMTIKGGAKCNLNLQLRTQHWEGNGPAVGESAGLRVFANTVIQDNGELKIYRSQFNAPDGTSAKCIEIFRPITGQGSSVNDARIVVDLPYSVSSQLAKDNAPYGSSLGTGGVNFDGLPWSAMGTYPGAQIIVNGSTVYGLRVQGYDQYVTNLLSGARLNQLSGSAGVLTIAITNNATYTLNDGPANTACAVAVGFDTQGGNSPEYIVAANTLVTNFQRLVIKGGRVTLQNGLNMPKNLRLLGGTTAVPDGGAVTLAQLVFSSNATIAMGTAGGSGATLRFANSAAAAWTAGQTLTISNWNGSASGGGPDQIKLGTDATGLTTAQLTQVKWINPFGGGDVTGAKILATGEIVPITPPTVITSPAIVNGQFVFTVTGVAGQTSVIQWATNLTPTVNWYNILTNTGTFNFTNSLPYPEQFYRVLVP